MKRLYRVTMTYTEVVWADNASEAMDILYGERRNLDFGPNMTAKAITKKDQIPRGYDYRCLAYSEDNEQRVLGQLAPELFTK